MSTISAIGTHISTIGTSQQSYWTPQTLVVENTEPTKVVMIGLVGNSSYVTSDFTIAGFTVNSLSRDITNKIITLRLSTPVVFGDVLNIILKNKSYLVTNNVTVVFADNMTGTSIDTNKWDVTNPNSILSLDANINELIVNPLHSSTYAEFTNKLSSIKSISSGIAVLQGWISWIVDSTAEVIGGLYLYKDSSNFASITARRTGGGKYRCRIYTGGVSRYDDVATNAVVKAKDVKIWTDGTDIKFYYWNINQWTQMGTTQTFTLGNPLKVIITSADNSTWTGGTPLKIDNLYFSKVDYATQYPYAKSPEVMLNNTAYCWFARQKAVYNSTVNKTFIGQVHDNDGNGYSQFIVEVNNSTGETSRCLVGTVDQSDDHNEPSILVRASDNKLFTCYSEHSGASIRYRLSTNPLDRALWGNENTIANADKVTYPSCFQSSNGNIYIFFREDTNGWSYVKSTNEGVNFGAKTIFFYGDGQRGYLTFCQSPIDVDIIQMVGTGGHPLYDFDISIFGFYFDCSDDSVHKLDGTDVTTEMPLTGIADMTEIMHNVRPDKGWIEDIIVDASGNPRYLMTFLPNGDNVEKITKELYYSEWTGMALTTPYKIHVAANKYMETGPLAISEWAYPPNSCFDKANPNRIFASKEVNGICEIFEITRISASLFTSIQRTFDSNYDQWRPFTVNAAQRNVFWLNKQSYNRYTDFNEQLVCGTL